MPSFVWQNSTTRALKVVLRGFVGPGFFLLVVCAWFCCMRSLPREKLQKPSRLSGRFFFALFLLLLGECQATVQENAGSWNMYKGSENNLRPRRFIESEGCATTKKKDY